MRLIVSLLLLAGMLLPPASAAPAPDSIHWESWSDTLFQRAKKEKKFVLLDLEAIWCHWCHVMDEETYKDPAVVKLVKAKYIPVKVDQDSRPDLSHKYEDYGWPATIVFNSGGSEIVKRSGYMNPQTYASMLDAIIKDPTPGPSAEKQPEKVTYAKDAFLSAALRKELQTRHVNGYDNKEGGWGTYNKFLDWDSVEYAMGRAKAGDAQATKMARGTLTAQLNLLDPAWGGVYQYSTDGDWKHAHFEKIMQMQAENLRIYALAYEQWRDPSYLQAAKEIERYLRTFLMSPDGAFYTSQDADLVKGVHSGGYFELPDETRRKKGVPRVDKHIYARENGWAIKALTTLYAATGDPKYLQEAERAAQWIIANRSIAGGGFRHDAQDSGGPFLGDTLAMGRSFLALYEATGDRAWLSKAEQAADFIGKHFQATGKGSSAAGFATAESHGNYARPEPLIEENVMLVRFANLLYQYDGKRSYQLMAQQAMRYLATPDIAKKFKILVAGILLADVELNSDPAHITVVGAKNDPDAKALFAAANAYPSGYKRVEWYDAKEGPLPHNDVEYPQMKKAAAFACANQRCSLPVYKPEGVAAMVDRLAAK